MKIDIYLTKTIQENANDYYSKSKKAKKTSAGLNTDVKELKSKVDTEQKNKTKEKKLINTKMEFDMNRKTFINDSLELFNSTLEKSNGNRRSTYPDAWRQSTTGKPLRKDRELGEIIVGLDIGTNKIAVIVAEIDEIEGMKIIGVGVSPSEGLRRGVVVNMDKTVQSSEKSGKEAELMSGIEIE